MRSLPVRTWPSRWAGGTVVGCACAVFALFQGEVTVSLPGVPPSWLAPRFAQRSGSGHEYLVLGNRADVATATRPGLVLQGGGDDLDESFRWMIGRSGGGDFLVLRSSGTDAYNPYIFNMVGRDARGAACRPDSVATLIVPTAGAARDPFVARTIEQAEAVWIAGGDQARHLAAWRGTPVMDALQELEARGIPLGGTSSGLAVLGEFVYSAEADAPGVGHLSSSLALRDPFHPRLTLRHDFLHLPLLAGFLLEPHFVQESRFGRISTLLARAVADGTSSLAVQGLGIERRTALLVEPDGLARVIGNPGDPTAGAFFVRLNGPAAICRPGVPLTAVGIEVAAFHPGQVVDLRSWPHGDGTPYRLDIDGGQVALARVHSEATHLGSSPLDPNFAGSAIADLD